MFRSIPIGLACLMAWVVVLVDPAAARTIEGVQFPESVRAGTSQMKLRGVGLLRYKVLFRGYVAALYQEEPHANDGEKAARRLEIEYFWDIPAGEFQKATVEGMRKNSEPKNFERMREQIDEFNQFYRDVASGDRYSLTYLPDQGTELALNGEPLGMMPGDDFATALFGIWLGEQPLDQGLKKKLLGEELS